MSEIDQTDIEATRAQLRDTLNEIEDRVNPVKVSQRLTASAKASIERDPTPWIAAAAGAVVVIAGIVAAVIFGRR